MFIHAITYMMLDHDPCSNFGNWGYVAGVGSDPRQDRYFNIMKQQKTHDPQSEYRKVHTTVQCIMASSSTFQILFAGQHTTPFHRFTWILCLLLCSELIYVFMCIYSFAHIMLQHGARTRCMHAIKITLKHYCNR